MESAKPASRKALLFKLAVVGLFGLVGLALLLRGVNLKAWLDQGLAWIRAAGPWVFFTAMALLPAAGVPVTLFTVSVGSVFAPTLGMPLVVVLSLLSLAVNVAITYWLARYALRPIVERLMVRLGYRLPNVDASDHWTLSIAVRATPGPPFFVQGYLLGLAQVPFGIYMVASVGFAWIYASGVIVFGEALLSGKGKVAMLGIGLLVAAVAVTKIVRRHLAKKSAGGGVQP
jgi:uncharacterized membrane protein YdjX (TVP38/TMEM64 family)